MLRKVKPHDAGAICEIYNYYVEKTAISFEEEPVCLKTMEERIEVIGAYYPFLVLEQDGAVAGYAYASTWKDRPAYRHSAELSIYLRHDVLGQGAGSRLMTALLGEIRQTKLHALISGITLPNENSVRLHERFGFKKIAHFPEVGRKFGQWLDVGYWTLLL